MERKLFLKSMVALSATAGLMSACADQPAAEASGNVLEKGLIVHNVYFWLREDLTAAEQQDFLQFFERLKKVPGIQSFHLGKAAATSPRAVVDHSFSYHILLTFPHLEDYALYEKHPDHLAAAAQFAPYWTKVEVKDTLIG